MENKKHNTAITSRLSWKECLESGLVIQEKQLVLKYLKATVKPKTSRQIATSLNKERTNITRTLFNLVKQAKVEVLKIDYCQTTGRKVKFYSSI